MSGQVEPPPSQWAAKPFPGTGSAKIRHSRGSGNPETFVIEVDSRFRGNDGPIEVDPRPAFAGVTGNDGLKETI